MGKGIVMRINDLKVEISKALGLCAKESGYDWRIIEHRKPMVDYVFLAVERFLEKNHRATTEAMPRNGE